MAEQSRRTSRRAPAASRSNAPRAVANDNSEVVIATLQNEKAALQKELATLRLKLADVPAKPARSPEDFAAAIRHSLDKLQAALGDMTNPVSNFAVRAFRLETNVHVEVTALGDVEYRFVDLGETPDPATLSRITLDVAPLPKQTSAGSFTDDQFKPGTDIGQIPGLSADQLAILHANQIDGVADFVAAATRARSQLELVSLLKTDRQGLAALLANAELLTVQGIDSGRAAVLVQAGISGLRNLSGLTAATIVKRFNAALKAAPRSDVKPLTTKEANLFVQAAQAFTGLKPKAASIAKAKPAP